MNDKDLFVVFHMTSYSFIARLSFLVIKKKRWCFSSHVQDQPASCETSSADLTGRGASRSDRMSEQLATGYYWDYIAPLGQHVLKYSSIPGTYSPPVYDQSVRWYHMKLPAHIKSVGALGLEQRMREFGLSYVYFRTDLNVLEIWSRSLEQSVLDLTVMFSRLQKTGSHLR